MKVLDSICVWALFGWALASIVMIEIRHPSGAVLDVPVLWLVVAILNSLRIRNDKAVRELRLFCVAYIGEFIR